MASYKKLSVNADFVYYCLVMLSLGNDDADQGYTKLTKAQLKKSLDFDYSIRPSVRTLETLYRFYSSGYSDGIPSKAVNRLL
jgi:hypothetical protein